MIKGWTIAGLILSVAGVVISIAVFAAG